LRPEEIAVVGDRLATDAVMANRMGCWGVWVREGVVERSRKSVWARWEGGVYEWLVRRGVRCPVPGGRSPFE
jgi:phosphatidylglycerophosphatase GEP4